MTPPTHKPLSDAEIEGSRDLVAGCSDITLVEWSEFNQVYDQAKAYNTVKAERDALYKLIEGLGVNALIAETDDEYIACEKTIRQIQALAQTIKGEG